MFYLRIFSIQRTKLICIRKCTDKNKGHHTVNVLNYGSLSRACNEGPSSIWFGSPSYFLDSSWNWYYLKVVWISMLILSKSTKLLNYLTRYKYLWSCFLGNEMSFVNPETSISQRLVSKMVNCLSVSLLVSCLSVSLLVCLYVLCLGCRWPVLVTLPMNMMNFPSVALSSFSVIAWGCDSLTVSLSLLPSMISRSSRNDSKLDFCPEIEFGRSNCVSAYIVGDSGVAWGAGALGAQAQAWSCRGSAVFLSRFCPLQILL